MLWHKSCEAYLAQTSFFSERKKTRSGYVCCLRLKSSFISGEGLAEFEESGKSDVEKIHKENVERLSKLSASEVLQEKEQIEAALGENERFWLLVVSLAACLTQDQTW